MRSEEEEKRRIELEEEIRERERKWEEEKKQVKKEEFSLASKMASLSSAPSSTAPLKISNQEEAKEALQKLYKHDDPTCFLLFQYLPSNPPGVLTLTERGEEDKLEEIASKLKENEIQFVVKQHLENQGGYSSTQRFLLIHWIGPLVPAGMQKVSFFSQSEFFTLSSFFCLGKKRREHQHREESWWNGARKWCS